MKYTISLSIIIVIICALFTFSCSSCKKSSNSSTDTATLYLHLHTDVDTNEVDDPSVLYPDGNGRFIGLTVAQFYISNITLTKTDGTITSLPGAYVLKTIGNEEYAVGSIPVGSYKFISFYVGVDATNNATNPSTHAAPSPLALQTPSMWFGDVTKGYIFMNIQGVAQDNVGGIKIPVSYQIGSNALYESVTLPTHNPVYTVAAKQVLTVHIICDYGKLLKSVTSFSSNPSTDTYTTNPTLAKTIANNIPNMFRYEE